MVPEPSFSELKIEKKKIAGSLLQLRLVTRLAT